MKNRKNKKMILKLISSDDRDYFVLREQPDFIIASQKKGSKVIKILRGW